MFRRLLHTHRWSGWVSTRDRSAIVHVCPCGVAEEHPAYQPLGGK